MVKEEVFQSENRKLFSIIHETQKVIYKRRTLIKFGVEKFKREILENHVFTQSVRDGLGVRNKT